MGKRIGARPLWEPRYSYSYEEGLAQVGRAGKIVRVVNKGSLGLLHMMGKRECVECPKKADPCPECPAGQQCQQLSMSCTRCSENRCVPIDALDDGGADSAVSADSKSGKVAVGAIIGGVVGGLLLLVGLGLLTYYHKYWRKRKQRYADTVGSDPPDDEKAMYKAADSAGGNGTPKGDMAAAYQPRNRSSAATMATRASNVLPVAYIPGVTAVGKKFRNRHLFNNGDTRSHITLGSSILGGDDDDFDDDSEIGSQAGDRSSVGVQHAGNLTTAIRAKPKLVQINEEDETEDTESLPPAGSSSTTGALPRKAAVTVEAAPEAAKAVSAALSQDPFHMDGEDDNHDKDKDEGTDSNDEPDDDDDEGSFILDVEVAEPIRKNSLRR